MGKKRKSQRQKHGEEDGKSKDTSSKAKADGVKKKKIERTLCPDPHFIDTDFSARNDVMGSQLAMTQSTSGKFVPTFSKKTSLSKKALDCVNKTCSVQIESIDICERKTNILQQDTQPSCANAHDNKSGKEDHTDTVDDSVSLNIVEMEEQLNVVKHSPVVPKLQPDTVPEAPCHLESDNEGQPHVDHPSTTEANVSEDRDQSTVSHLSPNHTGNNQAVIVNLSQVEDKQGTELTMKMPKGNVPGSSVPIAESVKLNEESNVASSDQAPVEACASGCPKENTSDSLAQCHAAQTDNREVPSMGANTGDRDVQANLDDVTFSTDDLEVTDSQLCEAEENIQDNIGTNALAAAGSSSVNNKPVRNVPLTRIQRKPPNKIASLVALKRDFVKLDNMVETFRRKLHALGKELKSERESLIFNHQLQEVKTAIFQHQ